MVEAQISLRRQREASGSRRLYGNYSDGERETFQIDGKPESRVVSRIFENREFGFLKVTVERPLRLNFAATEERIARLDTQSAFVNLAVSKKRKDAKAVEAEEEEGRVQQQAIRDLLRSLASKRIYMDREHFSSDLDAEARRVKVKLPAALRKAILAALSERDPQAEICRDADGYPKEPKSMTKHNAKNERIKRKYFAYVKEARRYSEPTVDATAKAISRFEAYNRFKDFKAYHFEQAIAFKRHLAEQTAQRSGEKLSKATLYATLTQLQKFFFWLAGQPGYKNLNYLDADYFNLSEKDTRIATAHREQRSPTLEQVKHVIRAMPVASEIERRNRALISFALLTGARDSAISSIKLKHVDLIERSVFQDARDVKTKFSKSFNTFFFPVGDEIASIFLDWANYLLQEKLWGGDDPLFPSTSIAIGKSLRFEVVGLERKHWSNATPIRTIFREAFEGAGLPYFNPHSLRKTLAQFGEQICRTPEEFKAWSQNLGHDQALTTFTSYGAVRADRQGDIIRSLGRAEPRSTSVDSERILQQVADVLRRNGMEAFVPSLPQL